MAKNTPIGDYKTSRRVALAAALLAVGILLVGLMSVFSDYRALVAMRARVDEDNAQTKEDYLVILSDENERYIDTIRSVGVGVASTVDRLVAESQDPAMALREGVLEERISQVAPAVHQVIYQDSIARPFVVDRFGSVIADFDTSVFDSRVALGKSRNEVFVDDQGAALVENGIAAYFPVGRESGWVVLILRGDELALESNYVGTQPAGAVQAQVVDSNTYSTLRIATNLGDRDIISERQLISAIAKPSWLPLILSTLAQLLTVFAIGVLARYISRQLSSSASRLAAASAIPLGVRSDFDFNVVGVLQLDERAVIKDVNKTYCEQVGQTREDLIGQSILSFTEPADRLRHMTHIDKVATGKEQVAKVDYRVRNASDEELWISAHMRRAETPDGFMMLVQTQDVTFERKAHWELAKQALHDDLTGLSNRAMLMHRLRDALGKARQNPDAQVGVMFIDVDRLKVVNDSLGHEVGDELIKHVGSRIRVGVDPKDIVARFSGDEFVVVREKVVSVSEMVAIAGRIRKALEKPFNSDEASIVATVSIGIAISSTSDRSADELIGDADAAMFKAKEGGGNRVAVFDEGMRELLFEKVALERDLHQAVEDGAVDMYYQPIVDSVDYATAGFEALIRWPHPERGLLTPGQFLPIAEEAGLQDKLDSLSLKKTCTQMAQWAAKYPYANDLYVSSNKLPRNFPKFANHIQQILSATGLPAELLVIEVVESALLEDADGALGAIDALKEMGVRVAIDDFGTGYSSLSYLTQFRPTTLKIDRAFVSLLPEDEATVSVVQAITEMALALDINVVAEGVETWEQAEVLRDMGVPYFQGYLFAKPRPADEIETWLQDQQNARDAKAQPEEMMSETF